MDDVTRMRLFVDMDGTLARFHDRILDDEGVIQIEKMYEPGFFWNLPPFESMVEGVRLFREYYPQVEVFILSAVVDRGIAEQKDAWLDAYLPEIDSEHRIYTSMGKDKSEFIPGGIGESDWIIDDYNKNLVEWQVAGGSSIKCVNNINHKGLGAWGGEKGRLWEGLTVDYKYGAVEIARTIATRMGIEDRYVLSEDIARQAQDLTPEQLKVIESVSMFAIDEGRLLTLKEQRQVQDEAFSWTGDERYSRKPFVLMLDTSFLGIPELESRPVILRRKDIKHIYNRHAEDGQMPLSFLEITEKLDGLSFELANNVLVYGDPDFNNHYCFVLNKRSRGGSEIISILDVDVSMGHIDVSSVVSVHGKKDLFSRIEKTLKANRPVYMNKRTGDWLESARDVSGKTSNHLLEMYYNEIEGVGQIMDKPQVEFVDGGYTLINGMFVVRPDDVLERVYEKQLETDHAVWFGIEEETDENGNTVMFRKGDGGALAYASNNYFAWGALIEELERVWMGDVEPLFISDRAQDALDDLASDYGWEKAPADLLEVAKAVSLDQAEQGKNIEPPDKGAR